jgi:hypothetical protein
MSSNQQKNKISLKFPLPVKQNLFPKHEESFVTKAEKIETNEKISIL